MHQNDYNDSHFLCAFGTLKKGISLQSAKFQFWSSGSTFLTDDLHDFKVIN